MKTNKHPINNSTVANKFSLILKLRKYINDDNNKIYITSIFPYFIIGFLAFGLIRTIGDQFVFQSGSEIWNNFIYYIKYSAEILLITAMSAVGFNTKLSRFKNLGLKPFYLGFIAALSVGVVSFIVIYFLV